MIAKKFQPVNKQNMHKLKLIIENSFIESTATSSELGITVYERVFNKLAKEGKSLGKVQPIYIEIHGTYKIFGVLTLNKSGTYSFFPEFTDGLPFDHITFVKDLSKNNHHYTRNTPDGREKVLPIFAEHLTNGMYHALSFACEPSFLKDAPREVFYPEVNVDSASELTDAFFTAGTQEGSILIKPGEGTGTVCVQFFLIPKETDYKNMIIYPEGYKKIQTDFEIEEGREVSTSYTVVPHVYQTDYVLGIAVFFYNKKMDSPLMIAGAANREGFYSKIDIEPPRRA